MNKKIKRFYSTVTTKSDENGFRVELDGRSIKSAGQQIIQLPHQNMADQLAFEWSQQEEFIEFENMPIMRFASSVNDNIMPRSDDARAEILKYAHSDLLCYRVSEPVSLTERQAQLWDPVLRQFKEELDIEFRTSTGIQYVEQGSDHMKRFSALIAPLKNYQLGTVHLVTVMTGSAVLAMAHFKNWLSCKSVWELAHLDEDFQIEQWGEDQEATLRRQRRYIELCAAALVYDG